MPGPLFRSLSSCPAYKPLYFIHPSQHLTLQLCQNPTVPENSMCFHSSLPSILFLFLLGPFQKGSRVLQVRLRANYPGSHADLEDFRVPASPLHTMGPQVPLCGPNIRKAAHLVFTNTEIWEIPSTGRSLGKKYCEMC